jgi:hypothetical protein
MNLEDIRKKLKNYNENDIILKEHALIKCFQRGITREMIVDNLLSPERLIDFIEEESRFIGVSELKLIFEQSRNKNFIIIIAVNKKIERDNLGDKVQKMDKTIEFEVRK